MNELKQNRMLVVLAHPDDESFGAGGTLAKYAHQDVQVILLCATRGEAGISGVEREEAGKIREQELLQAAQHLGIEVHFLGYQDGELFKADPAKLLEELTCWIGLVEPQVILTFGPDGVSGHPDHITVSNIITQAVNQFYPNILLLYIAPSEATLLGCGVSSAHTNNEEPLVAVNISDYKIEKVRAIQSHVSQHPALDEILEKAVGQIPCHEYFTIAQTGNRSGHSVDWFENTAELSKQSI